HRRQPAHAHQTGEGSRPSGPARAGPRDVRARANGDSRRVRSAPSRARRAVTSRQIIVVNALGLHARAAARFVRVASRYRSRIQVTRGHRSMDGKSILGLLLLAAARGSVLEISADGTDELEALTAL